MTEQQTDLGYRPREWQRQCHLARRIKPGHFEGSWTGVIPIQVLVCHRRAGKSVLSVMEAIDSALQDKTGQGQYAYIAPQLNQAKRTIWDHLKAVVRLIPGSEVREADLYVSLPNGARISVFGADNPDALRGIYLNGAILDEFARMHKDTWEAVVQIALMDRKGWALFISTVAGVDQFSEMYHRALQDTTGRIIAASYDAYQTGVFTEAELDEKRRNMSEMHFRREFLNDFTAAADDQLISVELMHAAFARNPREDAWEGSPRILGVDVAFAESGDRSVIWRRQGVLSYRPWCKRGIDNMSLAAEVARQAQEWDPDAIFVDAGRGEGVISRLQQFGLSPIPVNFGGTPHDPRFRNKKAEMAFDVKKSLDEGHAIPSDNDTRRDFCGVRVKQSSVTGKIELVYEENLPSPDTLAACMLTFAEPVIPKPRGLREVEARMYRDVSSSRAAVGRDDPYYRF